jgi:hypothetical protein
MSGVIPLSKIQLGRETDAGTAVAATTILRVENAFLKDDQNIYMVPENVGLLVDTDRACVPEKAASLSIPDNVATFEQILHFLEMGIKTDTPAQDGAGDGYIYEYPFPTTAQLTPKTYTIEGGDDQQAMEVEYCHATKLTISGKYGEPIMFSADLVGRQATNTTFTGALSVPSVEEMLFQKTKLYISAVADGFGNDLITNTLLGFTLNIETGFKGRKTADGNLYFSYLKQVKPVVTLDLMLEHNATAEAEITAARANTTRAIRLLIEGSAFGTGGTTYSNKTAIIDIAGLYSEVPSIEDDDGSSIMNFKLEGKYNSTLAKLGQITVVTDLSAVP